MGHVAVSQDFSGVMEEGGNLDRDPMLKDFPEVSQKPGCCRAWDAPRVLSIGAGALSAILLLLILRLAFFVDISRGREWEQRMRCHSLFLNSEARNYQGWTLEPACEDFVRRYIEGGEYRSDVEKAVQLAQEFALGLRVLGDGKDLFVLDIDETALSNVDYEMKHHFGARGFDSASWNEWVDSAKAPPLVPTLGLTQTLQAKGWGVAFITGRNEHQRNVTEANLVAAGYKDWVTLEMRSASEKGETADTYKTRRRQQLSERGYRIWSALGDQWSDISSPYLMGNRSFKLANPMYYIA